MKKGTIIKIVLGIVLAGCLIVGIYVYSTMSGISEMFKLNAQLQAEGYYTGEFEFKMMACAYYLDHGQYITAFSRLNDIRKQMETREGLVKVPKFSDKKAEMEFYLSLQNPNTGAFMDDSYPAFLYYEPTENVINHMEELADATGEPVRLRYPMRFMDQFDTPEKLTATLDDLSTVGWLGAKLPKTCYVIATQFCSCEELQGVGRYKLGPGWKQALLKWFSDNQDPTTGTWGPRDRHTGRFLNSGDVNVTYRVIKLFVDEQGKDRRADYPLRYKKELFRTILGQIAMPMPTDASMAEIHDWNLSRTQGVKALTHILWQEATPADKKKAQAVMGKLVQNRFEKFYRAQEGGFVYYPDTKNATLDGTGSGIALLENVGALSAEKRNALWGNPAQTTKDLGVRSISRLSEADLGSLNDCNSIRVYRSLPQDFNDDVLCAVYPHETPVLDVVDLLPRTTRWLANTPQSMGNWTTRDSIYQELGGRVLPAVTVYQGDQGLETLNKVLKDNGQLVLVGFDTLQVPRISITFTAK
ncbi:MAG: hypothetical protein ACM3MK_03920 [Chitinophagales bacterium]